MFSIIFHLSAVVVHARKGKEEGGLQLLSGMQQHKPEPCVISFNTAGISCEKEGKWFLMHMYQNYVQLLGIRSHGTVVAPHHQ